MDGVNDKLLWVFLPLAGALLLVALLALRGRAPSRLDLNVGFSILLLVYVGTTAGLGIFWVANQQLPVFDWHYLFGYATVTLLLVHLAFNLRVVWNHLRRKRGAARLGADAAAAAPGAPGARGTPGASGRRPLLGAAGLAGLGLAAGGGYLLGLRHGRVELQFGGQGLPGSADPSAGPAGELQSARTGDAHAAQAGRSAAIAAAVVERFHAFSGHSRTRVLRHAASSDWGGAPPPFKKIAGAMRLRLPAPAGGSEGARGASPGLATLGAWLWHMAGISEWRGGIAFRSSPSSGALFATELYVLALDVGGVAPGPWHYDPEGHALQRLPRAQAGDRSAPAAHPAHPAPTHEALEALRPLGPLALPPGCVALVIASAIFARSGHKYGDRTYRYVLADLGHALENLRVAARAHGGHEAHLLTHFDEEAIGKALGLEARREAVLAVVALRAAAGSASAAVPTSSTTVGSGGVQWASPAPTDPAGEARLGLTEAMQWATSLRALAHAPGPAATPAAPQPDAAAAAPAAPAIPFLLPAPRRLDADWLRVIARRRSQRRFSAQALSPQLLADILHAMTDPAAALSTAVRIDVLTPAVQGLAAASWRHVPGTRAAQGVLQQRVVHGAALRKRARAAALDQDVIGDAAAVFVLSLDRAALQAGPFGPARGYRHGFIEAGLVGERLYLAGTALGLGVCAVGAFYDDEASTLVGVDPAREWVVHFAALGVPA